MLKFPSPLTTNFFTFSVMSSASLLLLLIVSQQLILPITLAPKLVSAQSQPTQYQPSTQQQQLATRLAERLESESYIIQFGNFNSGSGRREGTNYNLSYTLGQTAAGPYGDYGSSNYFIGAGFQYIYQIGEFSFTISDIDIELGTLTPNTHHTATNQLTINAKGAGGYQVYAYEQYPLTHHNGSTQIPDTSCDSGTCDQTEAKPWTINSVPGFGFNMQGENVSTDFTSDDPDCSTDNECFRQFADESSGETMQEIMGTDFIVTDDTGTVTYKLGVSGEQQAGTYQTGIVFIAVPGY
jgi:hypothetical protein